MAVSNTHRSTFLLIVVAALTAVVLAGPPAAANTPAALFWEQALPGAPMPSVIASLIQKGVDQSLLLEHKFVASPSSISACTLFDSTCSAKKVAGTGIFFHEAQLRPGSTMTLSFPAESVPAILPQSLSGKVPIGDIDNVISTFHIAPGSAEAAQVRDTVSRCRAPPIAGEVKSCTTSLEATVRSATRMLFRAPRDGDGGVFAAASELPSAGLPRGPYAVAAVAPLDGDRYAACHTLPFPYALYECHVSPTGYRAYKVSLRSRGGSAQSLCRSCGGAGQAVVDMLAFCHDDTSGWNPAHPAFEVLQTRPGGKPVCHFMPYGSLAFVKKATRA